jgi:hypothetical protein
MTLGHSEKESGFTPRQNLREYVCCLLYLYWFVRFHIALNLGRRKKTIDESENSSGKKNFGTRRNRA